MCRAAGHEVKSSRPKVVVITVHSNQAKGLSDEALGSLLSVESPEEPTEIVIHVNKLGEGWDVTNLYTIIPLRASVAEILTEQTIGRGLRLPFGKRTGVPDLDRLLIVSHDRYQAIIDAAKQTDSIIRKGVEIGRDIPLKKERIVKSPTKAEVAIFGGQIELVGGEIKNEKPMFESPAEIAVAKEAYREFMQLERTLGRKKPSDPEAQRQVVKIVRERMSPLQYGLEGTEEAKPDIEMICKQVSEKLEAEAIRVPRIVIQPRADHCFRFSLFTWQPPEVQYRPVDSELLIQEIRTNQVMKLQAGSGVVAERAYEDYLVRHLIDFDDVSYDENADLLYNLAGQTVSWLQSYLKEEEELQNVLQYHGRSLANEIHRQMQEHQEEEETEFENVIHTGYETLKSNEWTTASDERVRDHTDSQLDGGTIRQAVFDNFSRCTAFLQKFDSHTERIFAGILESSDGVIRWVKPAPGQLKIWLPDGSTYHPDFIVEAVDANYLCETKALREMETKDVQLKEKAARKWCETASAVSDKPWIYALIPHDAVTTTATFPALMDRFSKRSGE